MAASVFKIDGTYIKNPTGFLIERYDITTMERLANAEMAGDLIAKKMKFIFTYATLTTTELNTILNALWTPTSLFFTLTYEDDDTGPKTATVYKGKIPTQLYSAKSSEWVWKDVKFSLIEK